ncbi:MAG: hypothetical protein ACE5GD_08090, partial [Candidatus Geothermarchaeales archaeon]
LTFLLIFPSAGFKGFAGAPKGPELCASCHSEVFEDWKAGGHSYALLPSDIAQDLGYHDPPSGVSWDEVAYIIGKNRRILYVDKNGYLITWHFEGGVKKPGMNQWSVETERWIDYEPGKELTFNCGPCHTTNYDPEGALEGMPGVVGSWASPSVTCEGCHGMFNPKHLKEEVKQTAGDVLEDVWLCGRCHIRAPRPDVLAAQSFITLEDVKANKTLIDMVTNIDAEGGMIQPNEQFEEWYNSPHRAVNVTCQTCHEPHTLELRKVCGDCHQTQSNIFDTSLMKRLGVACNDCHMARAVKSAEGRADIFYGDAPSHLWKINTSDNATLVDNTGSHANPYLTLGWTCATPGCHGTAAVPIKIGNVTFRSLHVKWDTARAARVVSDIQEETAAKLAEVNIALSDARSAINKAEARGLSEEDLAWSKRLMDEAAGIVQSTRDDGTMGVHNPSGTLKDFDMALTLAENAALEVVTIMNETSSEICSRCHIIQHVKGGCLRCHDLTEMHEQHAEKKMICETCHNPEAHATFEKEDCAKCHGITLADLKMECAKCHTMGGRPSQECSVCHEQMMKARAEAISIWVEQTIMLSVGTMFTLVLAIIRLSPNRNKSKNQEGRR